MLKPCFPRCRLALCASLWMALPQMAWAKVETEEPTGVRTNTATSTLTVAASAALFDNGLAAFHRDDHKRAAGLFYSFVSRSASGVENYGWGQYFLAESLRNLGYPYAAQTYYYLVAKTRSQPEVISDSLWHLLEFSGTTTYDEELIDQDLLYNNDFGALPPELESWVGYVQGLNDYRSNAVDWGERHFRSIDKHSLYFLEAAYVRAVTVVRDRRDGDATKAMQAIVDSPIDAPDVKNRARLSLARLLFEAGRYAEAIDTYDSVAQTDLSYEQAQILTEKAWSSYYQKNYSKALGMLHALGAPSYDQFFFPETYLLRALIYKDLCHYLAAKNVVRGFRLKYGRTLTALKQRLPMENIDRIRNATVRTGSLARRTHLLQNLRGQSQHVGDVSGWRSSGLQDHLALIYRRALNTHDRRWHSQFIEVADRIARDLLDTSEQVNILDYEISLDIYKPLSDRQTLKEQTDVQTLPSRYLNDYYEFDGEYWNAELTDYRFYISSRCFEGQE